MRQKTSKPNTKKRREAVFQENKKSQQEKKGRKEIYKKIIYMI
jgi:hypothetical protein